MLDDHPAELVPLLLGIERQVGELRGSIDGVLREIARIAGQLELHVENDHEMHKVQDQRFLYEIKALAERVAVIEHARDREEGARGAWRRWAEWWRLLMASGFSSLATWSFGHWK